MDEKEVTKISTSLQDIFKDVSNCFNEEQYDMIQYCESLILLAEYAHSAEFLEDLRKSDDNLTKLCELLKVGSNSNNGNALFFKSFLICVLTSQSITAIEAKEIEVPLSELLKEFLTPNSSSKDSIISYQHITKSLRDKSLQLCERFIPTCGLFNIDDVDGTFLCLKSLHHMCSYVPDSSDKYFFCNSTVFQVVEKFHIVLMSPAYSLCNNVPSVDSSYDFQMAVLQECLLVIEAIAFEKTYKQKDIWKYKDNLFLKSLSRLLAFCIKVLFKQDKENPKSLDGLDFEKKSSVVPKYTYLHQNCLVATLKVLLNIYSSYDSLLAESTSLMEKLLICFIETSYSNLDCKFELFLVCLELMVNITEFRLIERKQFAKLCLMKFNFGDTAHLTVEILIKILICSLERIVALGNLRADNQPQSDDLNTVYQVAEEHMEHSFVCSYMCVFISYFCDIKQPFFAYVCERLSLEMAEGTIIVMSKFKDFIPLMGRQNEQAYNMLNQATRIFLKMVQIKRAENLDSQPFENNRAV